MNLKWFDRASVAATTAVHPLNFRFVCGPPRDPLVGDWGNFDRGLAPVQLIWPVELKRMAVDNACSPNVRIARAHLLIDMNPTAFAEFKPSGFCQTGFCPDPNDVEEIPNLL